MGSPVSWGLLAQVLAPTMILDYYAGLGSTFMEVTQAQQSANSAQFVIFGFGSLHNEVVHFVMCDGSARPINKTISPIVMSALATRDAGERVSDDF